MPAPSRSFSVRHVQLVRAALMAVVALMITFSPDHSAAIGLAAFAGFAISSALVLILAAWLVYPAGRRWPSFVLGLISLAAGMAAGVPAWRTAGLFFVVLIAWAVGTGITELVAGLRHRGEDGAKDQVITGSLSLLLALVLLIVPQTLNQTYTIDGAGTFSLTGIIVAVGIFGGYAAIVAVQLAIAGLSPRPKEQPADASDAPSVAEADRGGVS